MSKRAALCFQLPAATVEADRVPAWVQMVPAANADGRIVGRDGRAWFFRDPPAVIASTLGRIPIDINHAIDFAARNGLESPAAGWSEQLEVRNGAIWARVDWTPRGTAALSALEYRYLSPVFEFDDAGNVVRLLRASLVNNPNFDLALNAEELPASTPELNTEQPPMKTLLARLGLTEKATEAEAVTALDALVTTHNTALNAAKTPDLNTYVPRAEFDGMKTRALNAEGKLDADRKLALNAEVDREIDAAIAAGKIAPAGKEFYKATCSQDGGLEKFRAFVATAPVVLKPGEAVPGTAPNTGAALNAEQHQVMTAMGLDEATFRKANGL